MEPLRKQLVREMFQFEESMNASNKSLWKDIDELRAEYDRKSYEIWDKYDDLAEQAKRDTNDLVDEMERRTEEEVKRCRRLLHENERILREIEIWRQNLKNLFIREDRHDEEILCGLKEMDSKLSTGHRKWMRPREKCELSIVLPDWWQKAMEPFQSREIGFVRCDRKTFSAKKLIKENQWNFPAAKSKRRINAIHVIETDKHILCCDRFNRSLIEMNEQGDVMIEFPFSRVGNGNFEPTDICLISPHIFAVCGLAERQLFFLTESKSFHFVK